MLFYENDLLTNISGEHNQLYLFLFILPVSLSKSFIVQCHLFPRGGVGWGQKDQQVHRETDKYAKLFFPSFFKSGMYKQESIH